MQNTLDDVPLLKQIKLLEDNRLSYLKMIRCLKKKHMLDFRGVESNLLDLVKSWQKFRLVIAKYCFKRSMLDADNTIKRLINNVIDKEERLVNDLIALYKN